MLFVISRLQSKNSPRSSPKLTAGRGMSFLINFPGVGGSYDADALLRTWIDRIKIMGIDTDAVLGADSTVIDNNLLVEVGAAFTQIPSVSDPHPTYENTCCSHVRIVPMPASDGESP